MEERNNKTGKNERSKSRKCETSNEIEILRDQNVSASKRQSISKNRQIDICKTNNTNSPNKSSSGENCFYDDSENTSLDKSSDRSRKTRKSGQESHRVESKGRKKKANQPMVKQRNIRTSENDNGFDSSRSKDIEIQRRNELLEDTYNMPLDVSEIISTNISSKHTNTHEPIQDCYPPVPYDGSENDLVQQQQLWLLNSGTAPNEFEDEFRREKREVDDSASSDQSNLSPMEAFLPENQANIYMEVEQCQSFSSKNIH